MNSNVSDNPYAPPVAHVADIPAAGSQLASRGSRFVAVLIDTALQFGLLWVVSSVAPWNVFDREPTLTTSLLNGLLGLLLFMLVHGWLLVQRGQTVGKSLMGLRIVRSDGSRASAARLLGLRYALPYLLVPLPPFVPMAYGLIDALLIFRSSRKCLHDNIADTIVVRT